MSRRKTLLGNELPAFDPEAVVDDEAEKRSRATAEQHGNKDQQRKKPHEHNNSTHTAGATSNRMSVSAASSGTSIATPAVKPSNEQLSCLYNNCVKLLNENKINVKNAFQLKLIDYMTDIVLNTEIAGGATNFQVVGCTIDVGTKIYAARVDALHQNTYQMLSGLGTNANGDGQGDAGEFAADEEAGEDQMGDGDELTGENRAQKTKSKKKRMKKSTQIAENLDSITSKLRDDFKDEDLYFTKISQCIENEAIAGTLLNKLQYADDSFKLLINAEDKIHAMDDAADNDAATMAPSAGVELNLKDLVEHFRQKSNQIDWRNARLCPDLNSFKFIGWNLNSDDEISKLVERIEQTEEEELEAHRFDANNLQISQLNMTNAGGGGIDVDFDDNMSNHEMPLDNDDHFDQMSQQHQTGLEMLDKIDDIRSLNSLAELTTLISQSPSDYSYFNLDKLKLHDLPKHLKLVANRLLSENKNVANVQAKSSQAIVRNKKEAPRIDLSIMIDRMKFFKVTKKTTYLCDRTIEKRSEKPIRLETERQFDYDAKQLFQPFWKSISAKIFSDIDSVENLLLNDEMTNKQKESARLAPNNALMGNDDDDDAHIGDDFEIPCTGATNEPFFTEHGGEFGAPSQQTDFMMHMNNENDLNHVHMSQPDDPNAPQFDLIEAPLQVNALNIEYAKTSKNIDVRRLKAVIWSLLSNENDKENIENLNESDSNTTKKSTAVVNASLKDIYKQLRPPLISAKVFEDLSICIAFQILLFLANEHGLVLKNDPIGSDVIIQNAY